MNIDSQNLDKLRDEIIEFQKQRADLIKWKLISFGAVGSVVFGTTNGTSPSWLLGLIPLIASYIDLNTRQIDIRIALLAAYLKSIDGNIFSCYEKYLRSQKVNDISPWVLGNAASFYSSVLVTLFVTSYGIFQNDYVSISWGVVGLILAIAVEVKYQSTQKLLDDFVAANQNNSSKP